MTVTGLHPWRLYSAASLPTAATIRREFKISAKSRLTLAYRGKTIRAFSSATAASIGDDSKYGRRGFIYLAAIPFFLNLHESLEGYRANAAEDCSLVKEEIRKVLSKGKAAGVLRLVFHDAGTFEIDENAGGMNGSIVYELDRPENTGLKKPLKNDELIHDHDRLTPQWVHCCLDS